MKALIKRLADRISAPNVDYIEVEWQGWDAWVEYDLSSSNREH
ncbi:hypothetical protein [Marinomonas piezotolerans]|nr:hypothetical protein [Marinomonas piezotolerans]